MREVCWKMLVKTVPDLDLMRKSYATRDDEYPFPVDFEFALIDSIGPRQVAIAVLLSTLFIFELEITAEEVRFRALVADPHDEVTFDGSYELINGKGQGTYSFDRDKRKHVILLA